ncbi:MAG: hypothetical protein JAY67_19010 [Candidatus Thiodiazotropha taylori]|nr:hypothetical protein [Candidatus Thiodiazotropha taylori]MCG7908626.1 hypothetical protein [Candidatus Thiodiazotropha taylori]MCG7927614.1 hypothetical protein [Candidatus Thiodiazotropha taylori]MCG7936786.1 hypothetical protein [Candidatus Thiodiazotropha taylori]MCG8087670.1 hypothetical protein [Candidatus Thiodiazotropha taylori]
MTLEAILGMDSLFLFICVLCLWIALLSLGKSDLTAGRGKLWFGAMIASIIGAAIPVILISEGIVSSKPGNIVIAGFSAFYIAILAGRLDKS